MQRRFQFRTLCVVIGLLIIVTMLPHLYRCSMSPGDVADAVVGQWYVIPWVDGTTDDVDGTRYRSRLPHAATAVRFNDDGTITGILVEGNHFYRVRNAGDITFLTIEDAAGVTLDSYSLHLSCYRLILRHDSEVEHSALVFARATWW